MIYLYITVGWVGSNLLSVLALSRFTRERFAVVELADQNDLAVSA